THTLLVIFGQGINRREGRWFRFWGRQWLQHVTLDVADLPDASVQLGQRALRLGIQIAISSTVEPFTIDTHAGGDNQRLNGMLHEGFQEDSGTQRVNPEIFFQLIHALANTHGCSEVKHRRHAMQCLTYCVGMTNVLTDKFNLWMQVRGALLLHAVYLRGEHIQNAHLVTICEQFISEMRATK